MFSKSRSQSRKRDYDSESLDPVSIAKTQSHSSLVGELPEGGEEVPGAVTEPPVLGPQPVGARVAVLHPPPRLLQLLRVEAQGSGG